MPRPTDIASKATTESRRKGAHAANAKRRELSLSLRERIARHLERQARDLAEYFAWAACTLDPADAREAVAEVVRAIREDEQPRQLRAIPPAVFAELTAQLPTRSRRERKRASPTSKRPQ
jgi:hypothetical protein